MRNLTSLLILSVILFWNLELVAQKKVSDFQKNFNIAKQHLSKREIIKALPYLNYLNEKKPENANLKYLIGVCYAEAEIVNPKSIELLEVASSMASLEYDPNSLDETRVPIYVFYYLCLAYAQNGFCDKANNARDQFLEVYPHKDEFYINESEDWIRKCRGEKDKPVIMKIPSFTDFKPYTSSAKPLKKPRIIPSDTIFKKKEEISMPIIPLKPKENKVIKTHRVEYSTNSPLYGVQLGAFKEVVPVSRFKQFKNVDAFMDKEGLIRYVVGHFSIHSQAESLLNLIKSKGYSDAFVVNVNDEKMFSDEVISVDNINIRAGIIGRVEYRVQIGAFKEEIPEKTANMFLKIEGIKNFSQGEFTYLTAGSYSTYNEAKAYLQGIKAAGIDDAFVIAINNGKKISLQQAKDFENK